MSGTDDEGGGICAVLADQLDLQRRSLQGLRERLRRERGAEAALTGETERLRLECEAHDARLARAHTRHAALRSDKAAMLRDRAAAQREYERWQARYQQAHESEVAAMEAARRLADSLAQVNAERSRYRREHKHNTATLALLDHELGQLREDVAWLEQRWRPQWDKR
jgi:chromosome segregation ATPase